MITIECCLQYEGPIREIEYRAYLRRTKGGGSSSEDEPTEYDVQLTMYFFAYFAGVICTIKVEL